MTEAAYEKGKVKLVWIEDDPEKIYSKMFETEDEAEHYAREKLDDYVIFALEKQQNMEEFSWRILPYGSYKLYLRVVKSLHVDKQTLLHNLKNVFSR